MSITHSIPWFMAVSGWVGLCVCSVVGNILAWEPGLPVHIVFTALGMAAGFALCRRMRRLGSAAARRP